MTSLPDQRSRSQLQVIQKSYLRISGILAARLRNHVGLVGAGCLWLAPLVTVAAAAQESMERPNIVFLLADDPCTYSMGCYGNPDVGSDVQPPNLDQLAREGLVFDNRYASFARVLDRHVPWQQKRDAVLGLDAAQDNIIGIPCSHLIAAERELREETVCGTGQPENNGDSGVGIAMNVGDPFGVEIGPEGALYITEVRHHRVRRLDLGTGQLTTVAGCGRKGYSGDGGPATQAELNEPYEVRFDPPGNMYFVEMQNHVIRKVSAKTGVISTIAGTGQAGYGGDGGVAIDATFNRPHSIALDQRGNLYVADIGNHRIRRIDLHTGIVESIAGDGGKELPQAGQTARGKSVLGPRALMVDGTTLWVALREGHSVWTLDLQRGVWGHVAGTGSKGFTGDGGPARRATFSGPKGIAAGPQGAVYVADTENHAIRKIDTRSGIISTVAGRQGAATDQAAASPSLNRPHGICVSDTGTIYIGDTLNHRVQRVR